MLVLFLVLLRDGASADEIAGAFASTFPSSALDPLLLRKLGATVRSYQHLGPSNAHWLLCALLMAAAEHTIHAVLGTHHTALWSGHRYIPPLLAYTEMYLL